jgi:hypothetical protein
LRSPCEAMFPTRAPVFSFSSSSLLGGAAAWRLAVRAQQNGTVARRQLVHC